MLETIGRNGLYRKAIWVSILTMIYNLAEGLIASYFGFEDEALTLFGFGLDSFIETISAVGVLLMTVRIIRNPTSSRSAFEVSALQITGYSFYALAGLLALLIMLKLYTGHQPSTTFWGVVISLVSLGFMWLLIRAKEELGHKLSLDALLADAACARVCMYMSAVLLVSSAVYEISGFGFSDVIGSAGILYFCLKEGRECFSKAEGKSCSDQCGHC
jgi:divalent metal cation (Fe/Co/Zn/Cd) transporter